MAGKCAVAKFPGEVGFVFFSLVVAVTGLCDIGKPYIC